MRLTEKDMQMIAAYFDFGDILPEELNKMGLTPDSIGLTLERRDRVGRTVSYSTDIHFKFPTVVICGLCSKPVRGAILLRKNDLGLDDAEGFFVAAEHCVCDRCMATFGKAVREDQEKTQS